MPTASDRFHTTCSNGHRVLPMITADELQEALAEGWLVFYCDNCREGWQPTAAERLRVEQWLDRRELAVAGR